MPSKAVPAEMTQIPRLASALTDTFRENYQIDPEQKHIVYGHGVKQAFSLRNTRDLRNDVVTETLRKQCAGPVAPTRAGPASFGMTGPYRVRASDPFQ